MNSHNKRFYHCTVCFVLMHVDVRTDALQNFQQL
jgi:hypothetical protein